eukprot:jgi/Mesvir1/942/Mv17496-RA.3
MPRGPANAPKAAPTARQVASLDAFRFAPAGSSPAATTLKGGTSSSASPRLPAFTAKANMARVGSPGAAADDPQEQRPTHHEAAAAAAMVDAAGADAVGIRAAIAVGTSAAAAAGGEIRESMMVEGAGRRRQACKDAGKKGRCRGECGSPPIPTGMSDMGLGRHAQPGDPAAAGDYGTDPPWHRGVGRAMSSASGATGGVLSRARGAAAGAGSGAGGAPRPRRWNRAGRAGESSGAGACVRNSGGNQGCADGAGAGIICGTMQEGKRRRSADADSPPLSAAAKDRTRSREDSSHGAGLTARRGGGGVTTATTACDGVREDVPDALPVTVGGTAGHYNDSGACDSATAVTNLSSGRAQSGGNVSLQMCVALQTGVAPGGIRQPFIAQPPGLWREKFASVCDPCFASRVQCPHFPERRLRLLLVGHNPSDHAWASGHFYSNPTNRMVNLLRAGAIVPAWYRATDSNRLPAQHGVGFTDVGTVPGSDAQTFGHKVMLQWREDLYSRLVVRDYAIVKDYSQRGGPVLTAGGVRTYVEGLYLRTIFTGEELHAPLVVCDQGMFRGLSRGLLG